MIKPKIAKVDGWWVVSNKEDLLRSSYRWGDIFKANLYCLKLNTLESYTVIK